MPRYAAAARSLLPEVHPLSPDLRDLESERDNVSALHDFLNRGLEDERQEDDDSSDSDSDIEEDDLEREVTAVFGANIQSGTRYGYRRSQGKLACWIFNQGK